MNSFIDLDVSSQYFGEIVVEGGFDTCPGGRCQGTAAEQHRRLLNHLRWYTLIIRV
jgi:hypothetical protein